MPDLRTTNLDLDLPEGIRSRMVHDVNGLNMHVLEAGTQSPSRPCIVLLHGFPELAYSFRKIMLPLAQLGYYVVAPDQRGYGRTTGWSADYDGDISQFGMINLVRDIVSLLSALGVKQTEMVVGHDFGSMVAACASLIRPDLFRSLVMMSAPFAGPPKLPFNTSNAAQTDAEPPARDATDVHEQLAQLSIPRKHYQWYYCSRHANRDMLEGEQGLHRFLRAYFHFKSADWTDNQPAPLAGWRAEELAKMPRYYVMDLDKTMAETVAPEMPGESAINNCQWLTERELSFYTEEFKRTGFQGGLNWYRCRIEQPYANELALFSGRKVEVPAGFIAGARDWGIFQRPGDIDKMQTEFCPTWAGLNLIGEAGHWVQQEQPQAVTHCLIEFLSRFKRLSVST